MEAVLRQPGKFWLAVGGAAVMTIGALGPWATALGIVSKAGVDGDGLLVIGAAGVAVLLLWKHAQSGGRGVLIGTLALGLVSVAICVYDLIDIESQAQSEFFGERLDVIEPGWGIYASLLGAAALTIASVAMWRARVQPDPPLPTEEPDPPPPTEDPREH
jgi:hypothetical protein